MTANGELNAERARAHIKASDKFAPLEAVLAALFESDVARFKMSVTDYDEYGRVIRKVVRSVDKAYARLMVNELRREFSGLEARIEALEAAARLREGDGR